MFSGEVFEQTITVDGERATVTLLDTWDSQVTALVHQKFLVIYFISDWRFRDILISVSIRMRAAGHRSNVCRQETLSL